MYAARNSWTHHVQTYICKVNTTSNNKYPLLTGLTRRPPLNSSVTNRMANKASSRTCRSRRKFWLRRCMPSLDKSPGLVAPVRLQTARSISWKKCWGPRTHQRSRNAETQHQPDEACRNSTYHRGNSHLTLLLWLQLQIWLTSSSTKSEPHRQ